MTDRESTSRQTGNPHPDKRHLHHRQASTTPCDPCVSDPKPPSGAGTRPAPQPSTAATVPASTLHSTNKREQNHLVLSAPHPSTATVIPASTPHGPQETPKANFEELRWHRSVESSVCHPYIYRYINTQGGTPSARPSLTALPTGSCRHPHKKDMTLSSPWRGKAPSHMHRGA